MPSKYELLGVSKNKLDKIISILSLAGNIVISSYTDNVGNQTKNLELSQKRVQTVLNYLVSKGINKSNLLQKALEIKNLYEITAQKKVGLKTDVLK